MNNLHAPIVSIDSCTDGNSEIPTDRLEQCDSLSLILNLLAADINAHPERLLAVDTRGGYEVVIAIDGGIYVVAHWLYDNGMLDRFDRVH